jgi:hypothetical protein
MEVFPSSVVFFLAWFERSFFGERQVSEASQSFPSRFLLSHNEHLDSQSMAEKVKLSDGNEINSDEIFVGGNFHKTLTVSGGEVQVY